MTAQVFSNASTRTFYVDQALSANGAGVNARFVDLVVSGTATIQNLVASAISFLGTVKADFITTFTPGGDLALSAPAGNITLTPFGMGLVTVAPGVIFQADVVQASNPAGNLILEATTNGSVELAPNGAGQAIVLAGKTLTADFIQPTTAGTLTISTPAGSNGNINLIPDGTGAVTVAGGQRFTADLISPTTAGPLTISTPVGDISVAPTGNVNLAPGSVTTLSLLSTGIATNNATSAFGLTLNGAVAEKTALTSSTFGYSFTVTSGFTGGPPIINSAWHLQIGNTVLVNYAFDALAFDNGNNSANVDLPVPATYVFAGAAQEGYAAAFIGGVPFAVGMVPTAGVSNAAEIFTTTGVAGTYAFSLLFTYRIV